VSLFPFLAVLICTMGSLILLLVVIARQARLQACEPRVDDHEELRAEIDQELKLARFLASQYDASRETTTADLEEARLKLGQIEDHSGELRRQLSELQAAWKQLDRLESGEESTRQAAESELAALAIDIQKLERELDQAKTKAEGRQAAYCIVPYEGPHGTKRRPIYLECSAGGVVLQPEGVRFLADDFEGPLDAGNPLDVGLRSVREYLAAQQSSLNGTDSEAYPLLLVRPSGIAYFYAARSAMKSWGTEFGYELIGDDWELEFPQADPVLAQVVADAVEPARYRQQRLIAAAPSRYGGGGGGRPVYTVKPYRGGVASRGGGGGGDSERPSPLSLRPSGSQGRFGDQAGDASSAASQAGRPGGEQPGFGMAAQQPPAQAQRGGSPGSAQFGSSDQPGGPPGSAQSSSSGQPGGSPGSAGEERETAGGDAQSPSPGQNSQAKQSLAKTRGRNWGLPDANQSAVAITRPIRVECHSDRLVIVPERGLGQPRTIDVREGTETSVDAFVSAIWDYMEAWGKAGRGMYWRPVLNVYQGQDGGPTVSELEALLQDSGLLVSQAGQLAPLR
jgi:hypothetical protein